jgi:RNA polymerase sigma-70 factor (ECF subfamily)
LVARYEPLIRRHIRLHLEDQRLARVFDSGDICQSVLASFFLRATVGQYELERPEQLLKLLVQMAKNKLASAARAQYRKRRDTRRVQASDSAAMQQVAGSDPTPSKQVAGRELWQQFRDHLSEEERQLVELRSEGMAWADIAARMGGTPQARRMQLSRAVERISAALQLDN